MSEATANLALPFLVSGQAQKHVTVNESLLRLDALVQLAVVSASSAAQPGAPSDGQIYILPSGKTGADWGEMTNGALAYYRDGVWEQLTPREGWIAYVKDNDRLYVYSGSGWAELTISALSNLLAQRDAGQLSGFRNRLINGGFRFSQRGAASNADDTYGFDRWNVLTQSGAIACSQLTDPETGAPYGLRLTQSQASAQRMGVAQIVESAHCKDLRSVVTTLAGRVQLSTSANVRYAVLEWTGAADSVTSDVVNDWTSSTYTAGNFFISTNLNVLAVGVVACAAAAWRALDALNATLGASANNIIVFVWSEGTLAQNATLDLNRMQWEPGAVATPFEHRPFNTELTLCERYYEKSFAVDTAPAQNIGTATGEYRFVATLAGAVTNRACDIRYRTRKRAAATRTTYNPAAANANARDLQAAADCSATSLANGSENGFSIAVTTPAGTAVGNYIAVHWTAEAEL